MCRGGVDGGDGGGPNSSPSMCCSHYILTHIFSPRLVEIFTFVSNLDERKVGVWLDLKLGFWKVEAHFLDKENGHNEPRACGAGWGDGVSV